MIDGLDHVGVLVTDLGAALPYYTGRLGLEVEAEEDLPEVGVRMAFLRLGPARLQLVQPTRPGPLADHLAAHGEGLHHVCFGVADIGAAVAALEPAARERIVVGAGGRRACFLSDRPNGVGLELREAAASAGA